MLLAPDPIWVLPVLPFEPPTSAAAYPALNVLRLHVTTIMQLNQISFDVPLLFPMLKTIDVCNLDQFGGCCIAEVASLLLCRVASIPACQQVILLQ